jgi:hypothetical protein
MDGTLFHLPFEAVEDLDSKNNPDVKNYQNIVKYLENTKKTYVYQMLDLNNDIDDKHMKLETNLA